MTNPHDIIKKPVVTEQSMMEMANKKYTFVVAKDANKTEIKKAVESYLLLVLLQSFLFYYFISSITRFLHALLLLF